MLYAANKLNTCAPGGVNYAGECYFGCATSNPARLLPNCTCPSGYFDNSVTGQCEVQFTPQNIPIKIMEKYTSECGGNMIQAALYPYAASTFFTVCDSDTYLRSYQI